MAYIEWDRNLPSSTKQRRHRRGQIGILNVNVANQNAPKAKKLRREQRKLEMKAAKKETRKQLA